MRYRKKIENFKENIFHVTIAKLFCSKKHVYNAGIIQFFYFWL